MPRSFLVKSKRTHQFGQSKLSYRQHYQLETDSNLPVQHVIWQDMKYPGNSVQPMAPTMKVTGPLANAYPLLDGMAVWSHSAAANVSWPSGTE